MRRKLFLLYFICVFYSCREETGSLIPDYQLLPGNWQTISVSYDSSGMNVTRFIDYDLLEINQDLTYTIYYKMEHAIENGYVRIKSQTPSHLELFFEAHYPSYSSFAGSHIFSPVNVSLVRLTKDELLFRDVKNDFSPPKEYHFSRK